MKMSDKHFIKFELNKRLLALKNKSQHTHRRSWARIASLPIESDLVQKLESVTAPKWQRVRIASTGDLKTKLLSYKLYKLSL